MPNSESVRELDHGSIDGATTTGDRRWPGPNRDDLLGQRARQRSSGEIDDAAVATADAGLTLPEFPSLEDDCYLLDPDAQSPRSRRTATIGTLHALALDTALSAGGDVVWIDAQGHATTHAFAQVVPSERALDRVHIARAFTTHQHVTLVDQLGRWLRDDPTSPFGGPATDRPAVVVAPALDALYRGGDLRNDDAQALLLRSLATLRAISRDHNLPVILTRARPDGVATALETAATTIALEETRFGPRFECEELDFETLVYDVGDGIQQTTITYWAEILAARHPSVATGASSPAPSSVGRSGSSTIAGLGDAR
ncbi:P-loop NTPase family protein [Halococcoides cellulosivorans]|uniref:hypothetical protein n=1 Tax=Halococcoides cellulosivorans TaxID=1679096 RepID=UPI001F47F3BE|nr:hypothetical protein [Halococcoides cellulosivorans]